MIHYIADLIRGINADNIAPYILADTWPPFNRITYGYHADNIRIQGGQHTPTTAHKRHQERLHGRLMVLYLADRERLHGRLLDDIGAYNIS